MEKCSLCETRPPRRNCPALGKDICAQCCGSKREVTVDCPLDCPYLIEARAHEQTVPVGEYPNREVELSDAFLERNKPLYIFVLGTLNQAAKENPAVIDADMREAIAALVQKYRAKQSGLIVEPALPNPIAATVLNSFEQKMEGFREKVSTENVDPVVFIDNNMFKVMVFLDRFAALKNNGRPKGRHFLSLLRFMFPPTEPKSELVAG